MKLRAKKGKLAALLPAVWAASAALLIFMAATGCLVQHGSQPGESTPIALPAPKPAVNVAIAEFHANVEPILQARCYQCHSGADNHTPVAFDKLTTQDSILKDPELWLKVIKNTR